MKKAIITGPTGAIGVALIEKLLEKDFFIYAVCHKKSTRVSNIPVHENVKIVMCDLDELDLLPEMISDCCDVFYHFGWMATIGEGRNDACLQLKNIQYTLDAVDSAYKLNCKRFIGAGSQAEYGRVEGVLSPSTATFPETGYGIAKLCAGQMSRLRCQQYGIEHIWTRILSVYGPFDGPKTLISSVISSLLKGEKPALTKGIQLWDYLYSKDAANAFYLIAQKGKTNKIYCIGSGDANELRTYINIISEKIDPSIPLGFGEIAYSDASVMHLEADIKDLQNDTGFVPEYSFEKGICETIEWFKNR